MAERHIGLPGFIGQAIHECEVHQLCVPVNLVPTPAPRWGKPTVGLCGRHGCTEWAQYLGFVETNAERRTAIGREDNEWVSSWHYCSSVLKRRKGGACCPQQGGAS